RGDHEHPSTSSIRSAAAFRSAYILFRESNQASPLLFNASVAACCKPRNIPESMLLFTFNTASMYAFFPAPHPSRQPAILWDLDSEFNSSATSSAPSIESRLIGVSLRIMLYGLSLTIRN